MQLKLIQEEKGHSDLAGITDWISQGLAIQEQQCVPPNDSTINYEPMPRFQTSDCS